MKRLIYLAAAVLSLLSMTASSASGQEFKYTKHLRFKGILIEGAPEDFVSRLKKDGFREVERDTGIVILEGPFAMHDDSWVYVVSVGGKVVRVTAELPESENLSAVKEEYDVMKKALAEQLGVAPESEEHMPPAPKPVKGKKVKWEPYQAFVDGTALWESRFWLPEGNVRLSIEYAGYEKMVGVVVEYNDGSRGVSGRSADGKAPVDTVFTGRWEAPEK